jgi:hypothetical protein
LVDDVGEPAFEDAEGLHAAVASGLAAFDQGPGAGMDTGLSHRDAVECCIQLAVPGPGESMPGAVGGPHRQRGCAVVPGVGVFGDEAIDAGCLAKDLGCGK